MRTPGSIHTALIEAVERLRPSPTAALDAQLLLAHVTETNRAWVLAHGEHRLSDEHRRHVERLISARAQGVPVAYLRGFVDWFGLRLETVSGVLIPRPETELVAETAIEIARRVAASRLADIGTGSGAIAAAMALNLPESHIDAVDLSIDAVALARRNVARLGLGERIAVLHGDLLQPLTVAPDLIVANLPYLSSAGMLRLDADVRHEPASALHAGENGIELYRRLRDQIDDRGWRAPVVLEIDPGQESAVAALLHGMHTPGRVTFRKDYAGRVRIASFEPE
ncbi:MAG: peptide chain release factor N(5)-glutamine methyltransferase [Chloroflexota bacterium]